MKIKAKVKVALPEEGRPWKYLINYYQLCEHVFLYETAFVIDLIHGTKLLI